MWKVLDNWVDRYLSNEEAVLLALMLLAAFGLIVLAGGLLGPVLAALVLAFLLQGIVALLERWGIPHLAAVWVVFLAFLGVFALGAFFLLPITAQQSIHLLSEVPAMVRAWQIRLQQLPEHYPHLISEDQLDHLVQYTTREITRFVEGVLAFSVSRFPNLVGLLVYLLLVPLLVFFLLKDRRQLLAMLAGLLPAERPVMRQIWNEMNLQMANYVRGKVAEIVIVGAVTYAVFAVLGVNYAALLALLVGLSVVIPYIGAAVVTIPVLAVGYAQWGWGGEFFTLCGAYLVIQFLDGNVLVPILFSEAVNLHPVAIILAVLLFGGIWGLWGVFFAIPLATLVKALYNAWPRTHAEVQPAADETADGSSP